MPGKFLIDLTDDRFRIPANDEVIDFIRRVNPFAHSDVGSLLIELGEQFPDTHAYCPSYRSCAYVVLHTDANRIFAIAFGQRALAFRLPPALHDAALEEGGVAYTNIGPDWFEIDPWPIPPIAGQPERLRRWCAAALAYALL